MSVIDRQEGAPGPPAGALWTVVGGGGLGLAATYWDDGRHAQIGRDSALIPPHLLLYGSIGLVGAVLATWVLTVLWRTRSVSATLGTPGLALAVSAGMVTAGTAPADAAWHSAFSRDSVLWSPPHLLSVIGTAVLVTAILIGAGRDCSRAVRIALAAVLLGAAEVVVLEYETDVPQFSDSLYLPALLVVALAASWVIRTLLVGMTAVTWTVLGYLVFRLAILGTFAVAGWTVPELPVALLGLLLLGVPARWGPVRWPLAGLAVVGLQLLASVAGLSTVATGPTLLAAAFTVPVLVAALMVLVSRHGARTAVVLMFVLLSLWSAVPRAYAHDPGQGEELATAVVSAQDDGAGRMSIRVTEISDAQGGDLARPGWSRGAGDKS